jgi:predicted Zn-dependent protease
MTNDSINHPSHYTRGSIEVWDFIRDQELSYHLGCAVKYICRAGYKNDSIEDLHKAVAYLRNEIEFQQKVHQNLPM